VVRESRTKRIHCKGAWHEHKTKNINDSKLYSIRIPLVGRNIVMGIAAEYDGNFVVSGAWAVRVTSFVIGTNTTVLISALAAK